MMDQWYIPITILPGICLIILSTSNLLIALNDEIYQMCKDDSSIDILRRKIRQLERLSKSMVLLYCATAFLVLSGILLAFDLKITGVNLGFLGMVSGILLTLGSLVLLISYASHAVKIRKDQYKLSLDNISK